MTNQQGDGFRVYLSPEDGMQRMDIKILGTVTLFDLPVLLRRALELVESGEFQVKDGEARQ